MQTLILVTLCLGGVYGGLVRRAVPASSYVRTEEGQKVAIPGLETTTTIDTALGEVFGFGDTTLAQDNETTSTTATPSSPSSSSEATTTQKSTTTLEPITEQSKVTSTADTEKKPDATSTSTSTSAAPASSSEKAPNAQGGGGSFGFNVALPAVPTLPPFDKIKIPNPFGGGFFSG